MAILTVRRENKCLWSCRWYGEGKPSPQSLASVVHVDCENRYHCTSSSLTTFAVSSWTEIIQRATRPHAEDGFCWYTVFVQRQADELLLPFATEKRKSPINQISIFHLPHTTGFPQQDEGAESCKKLHKLFCFQWIKDTELPNWSSINNTVAVSTFRALYCCRNQNTSWRRRLQNSSLSMSLGIH